MIDGLSFEDEFIFMLILLSFLFGLFVIAWIWMYLNERKSRKCKAAENKRTFKIFKNKEKKKKDKVIKEEKEDYKDENIIKYLSFNPFTWFSIIRIKNSWKEFFSPHKLLLIHMELNNGYHRHFLVKENRESFKYQGKMYILDPDPKYKKWCISSKYYMYYFHESLSLPLEITVPTDLIKKQFSKSEKHQEITLALNPDSLDKFQSSSIVQAILQSAALQTTFRLLMIIGFITMIATIILLGLFAHSQGYFQGITGS